MARRQPRRTASELSNYVQNTGFEFEEYLKPPLALRFIVIPACAFGIVNITLIFIHDLYPGKPVLLLWLLAIAAVAWLCVSVRIRFDASWSSFIIAVAAIIMLLLSTGIFSYQDAANFLKDLKKE
jgi:hypothetical protein